MRVPLRSKLALAAAIPLALVALAVGAMVYRSLTLRSTEDFEARSLRLNDSIAAQLDGQLARAAQVARCTAAFVAVNPELTQQQIERTLAAALRQEPLIFGAAVAFEPGAFDPKRRLVAPYVVRNRSAAAGTSQGEADLRVLDIGAESYDYTDPKWEWYRLPRESGVAAWTEPYFDRGAGDALLCTYGVPIVRDGRTIGVATVDVPIAELQDRLRPELREGERFFVLSRRGAFVSAPDATLVSVRTLQSVADERDDAALRRLSQMMLAGRRGIVQGDGLTRNGGEVDPTWYFFAPVPTSGWSLAVTVPVRAMSTIEQGNFRDSMPTLALGLVAVTGCVWAAARRFTRPIDDLSRAVKAMSSGRFDEVVVPKFRSNDELGELADSVEQTLGELRGRVPLLVREQVDHELRTRVDSEVEREVTRRLASAATRSGRRVATSIDPEDEPKSGPEAAAHDDAALHFAVPPTRPSSPRNFELRRGGGAGHDDGADLVDAVTRRDGVVVLSAIGAGGGGIAAISAAHSVRALLRGLIEATDDAARIVRETAKLSRGLGQPVSLALAVYRPGEGSAQIVVAGDARAGIMRRDAREERIGATLPAFGPTRTPGAAAAAANPIDAPAAHVLAIGDRLVLHSRSGRGSERAEWSLTRTA